MVTPGLETVLREMQESHQKLSERQLAFKVYLQQGPDEATTAWLRAQIAEHANRLALLDAVMGGLTEVAGTDYPDLALAEMPEEVQASMSAIEAHLAQTMKIMSAVKPAAPLATPPPTVDVTPTPPAAVTTSYSPETESHESRRGRRGSEGA